MTIMDDQIKDDGPQLSTDAPGARSTASYGPGFFVKLVLMAIINALGIYILVQAYSSQSWVLFGLMAALLVAVDWVYFSRRTLALKYLTPGLVFLAIFQLFVIFYTGYIAFTNYGFQHVLTKDRAVNSIIVNESKLRVPDSPQYPARILLEGDELGLAVLEEDGTILAGLNGDIAQEVGGEVSDGTITSVDGYEIVNANSLNSDQQRELANVRVGISENEDDGALGTTDGQRAYVFTSRLTYDEDADTFTSVQDGTVYSANDETGFYESEDGTNLVPGYRVFVGGKNFVDGFSDSRYAGPFWKVFAWTVVFAFLSVATTFLLGMILAMVMNNPNMKGQKIYRTLMLMPYAFPAIMTALLFAGMLNMRYGFFNQVLFGGADIPWLTDPTLAKFSVLMVNLWMGFPYMFLICTGALQSIPSELSEAARVDGANPFQVWRNVTVPHLMIAVTPLLISSFAFNFNNFNLIYLLTNGGPGMLDTSAPVGHTDILISMVYKIAGMTGQAPANYGLAAALSLVIFVIVGAVSLYSFRKSNALEGMN